MIVCFFFELACVLLPFLPALNPTVKIWKCEISVSGIHFQRGISAACMHKGYLKLSLL